MPATVDITVPETAAAAVRVFDSATLVADDVVATLARDGACVLRGLFDAAALDEVDGAVERWLARPAVAGVPGYAKVDAPKKLLSPTLLGGAVYDLLVDERVIDIVEQYMSSECILAEANLKYDAPVNYQYFAAHADFAVGWRKKTGSEPLTAAQLALPVGVGGAVYLHETHEGAFSYALRTHTLGAPHGQDLDSYPHDERRAILEHWTRIDGQRGDLVLFDDRGFHGPDQPSRSERTVILLDYYRVETFGRKQVAPFPIWSTDIGRLTPRQLRVLGAGADTWSTPHDYMQTRFRRSAAYGLVTGIIENAYLLRHFKAKLKSRLGRGTAPTSE